jgi:hypothetical protein
VGADVKAVVRLIVAHLLQKRICSFLDAHAPACTLDVTSVDVHCPRLV